MAGGGGADRREMVRKYKETPRPAGVYRVQHTPSGRTLLGAGPDAPAMLNRIRAELRMRGHRNHALQADWNAYGADAFLFEVVDLLPPSNDPGNDAEGELETLLALWREKLEVDGKY
ncbi:MAG: GIY-YIG nuclease family protein [Gemmatimonadota bacterium]|nr:GIY-YIG nuclease family protein [Gemmatimonadota bacterium]MDH5758300.1 GIY-YIG nuclease family protein [Gemmatimonadota bacterium]